MKNYSTPLQLVRYAKAFAEASAYAERGLCRFRVAAVSDKPNSFGLHGHVLVARNGEAYEVARSIGPWNESWSVYTRR